MATQKYIHIRIGPDEKAQIEQHARDNGVTPSQYVRTVALRGYPYQPLDRRLAALQMRETMLTALSQAPVEKQTAAIEAACNNVAMAIELYGYLTE